MKAEPVLKWCGGKRVLSPEILKRLPAKINTYYEPFVGGGAIFFALAAENRFHQAVLSDSNTELMNTYWTIAHDTGALLEALKKHKHDEKHYYEVRAHRPQGHVARAARFIYLNRTCFNGLYRVNKKGEFNVPFGDYKNPKICDEEGLSAVAPLIRRAHLQCVDFEQAAQFAREGDAIYFDPPYVPASASANFTAYAKEGFGPFEQARLQVCVKRLIDRGVHVLLSNSDTPLVRELYQGFKIEEVRAPRRVNSKGGKRGNVGEVLISP